MQPQLPPDFIADYLDMKRRLEIAEKSLTNDSVPVGTEILWPSSTALLPFNYMPEDGRAIDRVGYAALFQELGTTYGVGDGSTSFNIPNRTGAQVYEPAVAVWAAVTFGTGWANYTPAVGSGFGPCQYSLGADGFVTLRGLASKTGSGGAVVLNEVIATVPAGFRLNATSIEEIFNQDGATGGSGPSIRVDVTSAGNILYVGPSGTTVSGYLSLCGIRYDTGVLPTLTTAETSNWVIKVL